jgi:hypothetical protein
MTQAGYLTEPRIQSQQQIAEPKQHESRSQTIFMIEKVPQTSATVGDSTDDI